jgi:hypothetical protein
MNAFGKTFCTSLMTMVMLAGVTISAFGQGTGGGGPSSGVSSAGAKGLIKLQATVVCANCSLDETKAAHPELTDLYELSHEKGKVVIRVSAVNDSTSSGAESEGVSNRWTSISQPPQLSVRAEDHIFQKLLDKNNQSKEMEITGIIRSTRTLDISDITILG